MTTSQHAKQEAALQLGLKVSLFATNSRYFAVETAVLEKPDGRHVAYLRRRFIPPAFSLALIAEHTVAQGERLDTIAAQTLGDPELFWRICDGNNAIAPDELTDVDGRKLRITLPEGIPGAIDD